tara:strand:+ start:7514 stop:7660 length:147 start_codon:yes stop_codon:yes gene_type:complete
VIFFLTKVFLYEIIFLESLVWLETSEPSFKIIKLPVQFILGGKKGEKL